MVDYSNIEVMARLADIPIETKEICDKWLLITYDIPHTEAGDKARRVFLENARLAGATRHTDSVYLMPWTQDAEAIALQLATVGKVVTWTSHPTDTSLSPEITRDYDQKLAPLLDEIGERIDRIEEHIFKKRIKTAIRMMEKTEKMIGSAERAIIRRGSAELYILMTLLLQRFATIIA